MIRTWLFKILLFPISLLYGAGVWLRNIFYKHGVLKEVEFNIPIIGIGNLSVGGSGKTPHTEYLINLLSPYINIATLSRGYKRRTKGFVLARPIHSVLDIGDEAKQYKEKFPDVEVAVVENRSLGIPKLLQMKPAIQTIILDDAFQHRSVKPGLNILLTEFQYPFTRDFLLPVGRLREWRKGSQRADIIIVSKCPSILPEKRRLEFIKEFNALGHQKIFFSYYKYSQPYNIFNPEEKIQLDHNQHTILISGIARAEYLIEYLDETAASCHPLEFPDHHLFNSEDLERLKKVWINFPSEHKIIITTEKDATRLVLHRQFLEKEGLKVYAIPIQVDFHGMDQYLFPEEIKKFLLGFNA